MENMEITRLIFMSHWKTSIRFFFKIFNRKENKGSCYILKKILYLNMKGRVRKKSGDIGGKESFTSFRLLGW